MIKYNIDFIRFTITKNHLKIDGLLKICSNQNRFSESLVNTPQFSRIS